MPALRSAAPAENPYRRDPPLVGAVAAGGALGALARYLLASAWPHPAGFPWSTLVINLSGSLLIGALVTPSRAPAGAARVPRDRRAGRLHHVLDVRRGDA